MHSKYSNVTSTCSKNHKFLAGYNNFSSFRLWAEVFHVSSSGGGAVKWQQVSEDLVPVNITCIQDSPECVFHITAYNSQVDKILDVRLVQPGEFFFLLNFDCLEMKCSSITRKVFQKLIGERKLRLLDGSILLSLTLIV